MKQQNKQLKPVELEVYYSATFTCSMVGYLPYHADSLENSTLDEVACFFIDEVAYQLETNEAGYQLPDFSILLWELQAWNYASYYFDHYVIEVSIEPVD